ncbi:MAG TPA: hypothetical protein VFG55_06700 [Rhodanobacteraceae bacterium]|nr:hypothetical protein [Rhodanobacteraceae bacterium]
MSLSYFCAWGIVILLGSGLAALGMGLPRRLLDLASVFGSGAIIGMLTTAVVVGLVRPDAAREVYARLGWWLLIGAIAAWAMAFRLDRRRAAPMPSADRPNDRPTPAQRMFWWALLALTVLQMLPLLDEVLLRPVFPWDAWSAWMAKPKAWYLGGHFDRFVDAGTWLADRGNALRTIPSWYYPELGGWLQLWFASAAGAWNEPLLLLPWFVVYAGFLLAFHAQCRYLKIDACAALAATFAFASMPLVDAHVALAGYADLWIATVLGLVAALWLRWRAHRSMRLFGLMVLLALTLPLLKREGSIWLAGIAALIVLGESPPRWRRAVLVVCGAAIALAVLLVGIGLPWPGGNRQQVPLDSFLVSGLGQFDLAWRPQGLELVAAVFIEGNWHLLGFALLAGLALRRHRLREDADARLLGLFLLGGWCFLIGLFCFTPAAQWAEHNTAANRLLMHLVPCCVLFLALLWRRLPDAATPPTNEPASLPDRRARNSRSATPT